MKLKIFLVCFAWFCLVIMPSQSLAQTTIEPGADSWYTVEQTYVEFGSADLPTLPTGFFGPGSDPFDGRVYLEDEPQSVPWCGHCQANTIILRPEPTIYPLVPDTQNIPIEIEELNLVSTSPITVTGVSGWPESFFDVYMRLSPVPDVCSPGDMDVTILEDSCEGGGGSGGASGTIDRVGVIYNVEFEFVNTDPAYPYVVTPLDATLNASCFAYIPWQQEPIKETWPSYDNEFYAYGDEPLILQFAGDAGQHVLAAPQNERGYFSTSTFEEWYDVNIPLPTGGSHVRPMEPEEWEDYMQHWNDNFEEGEPYPENVFLPSKLYVWEGGGEGGTEPNDAGLIMTWGDDPCLSSGSYSSAWKWVYGADPDLRRSIIKVTVTPPSGPPGSGITNVSFAIVDGAKRRRSWQWNVPTTIPYDKPTTVVIDPAIPGVLATSPQADGYASAAGFNLANSRAFDVDENGQYIFNQVWVPPPGVPKFVNMWNYWHNLIVLPKPPASKFFVKWSQRPVPFEPNLPEDINGWDEMSDPCFRPIVADDWLCMDDRPITDIHWWGSFMGWTQPEPPPILPQAFHIGIWTDFPDPDPCDDPTVTFSHPDFLIWENICDNWVWNFAGYDVFPWEGDPCAWPRESCFQFNQLLSEDEWFWQDPNAPWDTDDDPNSAVYWLSIYPIFNAADYLDPEFRPWGWKTRPHYYNDDAVRIWDVTMPPVDWTGAIPPNWPPRPGAQVITSDPIFWPDPNDSWDLAFELSTNEPGPFDLTADLNGDGIVDFLDFAIFANQWLQTEPSP
jgi:hypothetical protein